MDFNIIKNIGLKNKDNIFKSFTNSENILEKGKAVPIGTRVKRKSGITEEKTADGWIRVKEGRDKAQNLDQSQKNTGSAPDMSEKVPKSTISPDMSEKIDNTQNNETISREVLSNKVSNIINNVKTKKGKILELYKLGLSNDQIVNYSGAKLSDVRWYTKKYNEESLNNINSNVQNNAKEKINNTSSSNSINNSNDQPPLVEYEKLPEINTKDRWDSYELFGKMMCLGAGKSMIAYGSGGVGKTYTLMGKGQIFDQFNMKEFDEEIHDSFESQQNEDGEEIERAPGKYLDKNSYDYVKITGKVSASEMFKTLAEHNGKVIIFDDCDSVLKDENAVNVLKGALDTTGDGTISWKVAGDITTEYSNIEGATRKEERGKVKNVLPKRFKFKGQVMFISNLEHKQMPQALISRALNVDLTMNADETSERLQQIYPHMDFQDPEGNKIEVSNEDKKAAADFIHKYRYDLDTSDLNARTLGKIAMIKKIADETGSGMDWRKAATSMLKKRK